MRRIVRRRLLVALLGMTGCAPRQPAPTVSLNAPVGRHGIIVAVRTLTGATGVNASILAVIGSPPGDVDGGDTEVILRADDGQTVSVVQANDTRFHVGMRVLLSPGALTQVVAVAPRS